MSDFSKKKYTTRQISMIAMLTAITAVLAVFGTFRVGNVLKFPTKFIPVFVCGALFGPFAGGFSAAAGDILNVVLAPSGAWIPWLTLTEFAEGFLIGIFFHKKSYKVVGYAARAAACSFLLFTISIFFTTYILTCYGYFPSFKAGVGVRIIPEVLKMLVKFAFMLIATRFMPLFEKEISRGYYNNTVGFHSVIKPGLERVSAILEEIGNPQDRLKCIHIAGTNGKGSVAAFLQAMLTRAGYKTGKYISPNLIKVNERISIDGEDIADSKLSDILCAIEAVIPKVKNKTGDEPTQFEIWTAAAFYYFAQEKCDYVVLETGLGGRLDATNVIKSNVMSVITRIDLDHTEYLGNTVALVAAEKAGIIKKGSYVVTVKQKDEAAKVIKQAAQIIKSEYREAVVPKEKKFEGIYEIFDNGEIKAKLSLGGVHQLENAAIAVEAARVLNLKKEDIVYGLENAKNPGRFEMVQNKMIYDGAHNPNGVKALAENLKRYYQGETFVFIMAAMKDKDIKSSLEILKDIGYEFRFTAVQDNERSEKAENLALLAEEIGLKACAFRTLKEALQNVPQDKTTVICGSLYLYKDFKISVEK